jgi:hypothetical protein
MALPWGLLTSVRCEVTVVPTLEPPHDTARVRTPWALAGMYAVPSQEAEVPAVGAGGGLGAYATSTVIA